MKITATISTYNRERYLPQLFDSLLRQTLDKKDFEVVFVNNNSPGNTEELARKFQEEHPEIQFSYHLETNQGLSFGRNRGIQESRGELITFLDDDAFPADDYLEKLVLYFSKYPNAAAFGSKILLHWEGEKAKWENKYINQILGYYNLGDEEKIIQFPDYPRGSNMTFRTSIFSEIGLFNTQLGRIGGQMLGGEEKDLFARISMNKNLEVRYVPDALVYHCVPIERTTNDFVKTQATGIGRSERLRTKESGYFQSLVKEKLKWIASLLLIVLYLLKGKPAAASMILKFRYWVSSGLLKK